LKRCARQLGQKHRPPTSGVKESGALSALPPVFACSACSMHQQVARPASTPQTKEVPQAGQVLAGGSSGTFDIVRLTLQIHSHRPRGKKTGLALCKRQ